MNKTNKNEFWETRGHRVSVDMSSQWGREAFEKTISNAPQMNPRGPDLDQVKLAPP